MTTIRPFDGDLDTHPSQRLPPPASPEEIAQYNLTLLSRLQRAISQNPTADLLPIVLNTPAPSRYHQQIHIARQQPLKPEEPPLSRAATFNQITLKDLGKKWQRNPELDLCSAFPTNTYPDGLREALENPIREPIPPPADYRTRLDAAETATVVYPLADCVTALLRQASATSTAPAGDGDGDANPNEPPPTNTRPQDQDSDSDQDPPLSGPDLLAALKRLLWTSPTLWESHFRGIVVKCNESVVVKVTAGNNDYTEYTSMLYLSTDPEAAALNIPAPRPLGLVNFAPFCAIFMSCVAGTTLTGVWPGLDHEGKMGVKGELEGVFGRLRRLGRGEGEVMGGVGGEGVKEMRVSDWPVEGVVVRDGKGWEELRFSARRWYGSRSFVEFLRGLGGEGKGGGGGGGSVFTHGDLRQDNVMVRWDDGVDGGRWVVSGIIDWEDSGFYPEEYECTKVTYTMSEVEENDWYLYLPECISPKRFAVHWLVDWLWGKMVGPV
ncbi:hypothetical protein FQN53_000815 [Emmonsiellopsis sp. PD_33]|nr:hypothetical protein FQN53_000815 [Emmonsiellopsis sp. PD_33]